MQGKVTIGGYAFFVGALAILALGAAPMPTSDAAFLRDALSNGTSDIDRAKIAAGSTHTSVRDYALVALSDVTTIDTQLEDFVRLLRVPLYTAVEPLYPTRYTPKPSNRTLPARARILRTTLSPVRYFQGEVASRQRALALFQYESQSGSDPKLRGYAKSVIPRIALELRRAKDGLATEKGHNRHP